jgi:hypothetical protein
VTVKVTPEFVMFSDDDLFHRFSYHKPADAHVPQFHEIRSQALDLARTMVAFCPPSAELVRALNHLDEAVFCANAAIARYPDTAS